MCPVRNFTASIEYFEPSTARRICIARILVQKQKKARTNSPGKASRARRGGNPETRSPRYARSSHGDVTLFVSQGAADRRRRRADGRRERMKSVTSRSLLVNAAAREDCTLARGAGAAAAIATSGPCQRAA